MKKIGFILTYKSGATINRILSMINVLPNYDIHVVGPIENFDNYKNFLKNRNITIHNVELNTKQNINNFIFRYFKEFYYSIKCSKKLNTLNCDFEIISIPFISLIITSRIFKNNSKKILDIRDLVWEYYDRSNFFQRIIFYFLKKIHLYFLRKYDNITLTNKFELNKVNEHLPNSNKTIISNGISELKFLEIQSKINQVNRKNKNQKIIITYIGNVGLAQNLLTFINVVKNFNKYEFRIVGDGNDFKNISNNILKNKIKNVKLIGRVKENEVIKHYANTDLLYAKLESKYYTAIPSKLYEYLSTGKPIIYSGKGASVELLKNFDNIFFINSNKTSLENALNKIRFYFNSDKNVKIIQENFIREKINLELIKIIN